MKVERKKVLLRMCLIAWGIPAVLLVFMIALRLSPWAVQSAHVSQASLNLVLVCLAVVGLANWVFFGTYLYRRLWKVFPYLGEREKGWTYAEGVFGLQGVGASMSSVLGMFMYLFGGGFWRAVLLVAVSMGLAILETARFPLRVAEVEDLIEGMG